MESSRRKSEHVGTRVLAVELELQLCAHMLEARQNVDQALQLIAWAHGLVQHTG